MSTEIALEIVCVIGILVCIIVMVLTYKGSK